jgi:NADH-quinone oxidoreductase subunit L
MNQIITLIPLLPLVGFLLNGLLRNKLSKQAVGFIACGVMLAAFALSVYVFANGAKEGQTVYLFDFINAGGVYIPFEFYIDHLNTIFLLIITGVGFLIHLYSTAYMHEEKNSHFARYFAYLNLFVFAMLLLVMGGNYIIMFIGWEGVGLCSYLLIGYWYKNQNYNNAAKKAFIMNRIGDLGFLLAVFWLLQKTGSTSFTQVFTPESLQKLTTGDITGITLLLFVGATGKSAQVPLFTWLPDAMAGPTPVSALIHAATMVTAGIYMIARSQALYNLAPVTQAVVAITGLVTAILAASIALKQNDIKKVLAYSTVSQLGFMFLGLGVGAYTGAVFHVMTHAFFKALLFLGAGSVIHGMHHEQDMRNYGGLKKYMPVTHFAMLMGCIAIAGIPGFSGFFSKDEILMGAYASNPLYYYIGLGGALLTAFYMFRLYAMTFHGQYRGDAHHHPHESPKAMTIPLIVLAVLSIVGGLIGIPELFVHGGHRLEQYLAPVFHSGAHGEAAAAHAVSHGTEWMLLVVSTALIIITIIFAFRKYAGYKATETEPAGLGKVLANKWYVDEIYNAAIVKPISATGRLLNSFIEKSGIDAIVNGVGKGIHGAARQMRLLQSGQIGSYLLNMVLGIFLIFAGFKLDWDLIGKNIVSAWSSVFVKVLVTALVLTVLGIAIWNSVQKSKKAAKEI